MTPLALTLTAILSQADAAPAEATQPEPTPTETSAADRAAAAAEKAALAAEKAAAAAQRIAEATTAKDKEPDKAEPKPSDWVGTVGAGLQFITGNAQTLTVSANIGLDRSWEVWKFGLKLNGAYALSNPDTNAATSVTSVTARRAQAIVRGDRSFGSFASLFVLGGSEFDHMKSIESRTYAELGTGLTFFDNKDADGKEKLFLRADLAMRAGYETRFQYFPAPASLPDYAIVILAPRAAVAFRWSLNKHVRFSEDLEFIPFVLAPDAGRLLINSNTKLSAAITENVSVTTSVLVNYDSQPPTVPGSTRSTTDVALMAGVEAVF